MFSHWVSIQNVFDVSWPALLAGNNEYNMRSLKESVLSQQWDTFYTSVSFLIITVLLCFNQLLNLN